jgi:hypothetical protein
MRKATDMNQRPLTTTTRAFSFLCTLALGVLASQAQAQNQSWFTQFGTNSEDGANDVVFVDGVDGFFVVGSTNGDLGGPSAGGKDAYLARFDRDGVQLWLHQFGTPAEEYGIALATDGVGGLFVAGDTEGDLGGPGAGLDDAFVARFDADGNQIWMRQFGSSKVEFVSDIVSDGVGGVLVLGITTGDLAGPSGWAGQFNVFLARYDIEGNQTWVRQFGSASDDRAFALMSDGVGGVVIGGWTFGDLGGPSAGGSDAFLARFSNLGALLWIRQFGTNFNDMVRGLLSDGEGGVMAAGVLGGSLVGISAGKEDAFLGRFDLKGNPIWMRQFGSSERDFVGDLASDGRGGVVVAGSTDGNLAGPSAGKSDAFLARFSPSGDRIWTRQFGSGFQDGTSAIAADGEGGVVAAGWVSRAKFGSWFPLDALVMRYTIDSCYADCDQATGNGVLDVFDFLCWQNDFVIGNSYACDCDTSTGPLVCDLLDFLCFQNAFVAACR